ncbi:unnamed protein product [Miscanthus lutarioriparius]|uniref:DJ-1/PfpI domain-containing protein n=1 Tax=Miscanthus lutarioriparius TaxID=422564 RepID=A0A811R574_9POAL|nr:unnamed protein product [Miscanthus lutarioriparius]
MGTEEMEAVIVAGVLRRAGADVTLASVEDGLEVEASCGSRIVADTHIASCADQVFDLVALPGGMPGSVRLRDSDILQRITVRQAEEKRLYGAICAAPAVVLTPWGLHRRKKVSGELTTSRGPGTAFQFALSFVQQMFGPHTAEDMNRILMAQTHDDLERSAEVNEFEWSVDRNPEVLIPIANGSEEMEIIILVDILRRAKINVVLASVEKSPTILGSQRIKIVADKSIMSASDSIYDLIILPGGAAGAERLHRSRILKKLLKQQMQAGRMYGGVCSALKVLQQQGLLEDKTVTAHHAVRQLCSFRGNFTVFSVPVFGLYFPRPQADTGIKGPELPRLFHSFVQVTQALCRKMYRHARKSQAMVKLLRWKGGARVKLLRWTWIQLSGLLIKGTL